MSRDLHLRFIMSLDQIQHGHFFLSRQKIQKRVLTHCHHIIVIVPPMEFSVQISLSSVVNHGISDDSDIETLI